MRPHWEGARHRGNVSVCHSRQRYQHDFLLKLRYFDPGKRRAHRCIFLDRFHAHFDPHIALVSSYALFFCFSPLYPSLLVILPQQRRLLCYEVIHTSSRALQPASLGNFALFPRCLRPVPRGRYNTPSPPSSSSFSFSSLFSSPQTNWSSRAYPDPYLTFCSPDAFYCSHLTCSHLSASRFFSPFLLFFRLFLCPVTADPTCNVLQGPLPVPLPPSPLPHPGPLADVHVVPVAGPPACSARGFRLPHPRSFHHPATGPPACSSRQIRLAAARSFRDVFRRVNVVPAPGPPACAPRLRLSFARARPEGIPTDPSRSFDHRHSDPSHSFDAVAAPRGSTCGS